MRPRPIRSVAVIGAGMGGLTASLYLLQQGYEVFLLERAKYPGGTAGFYRSRGRTYPTGATLTFGLEPGGLLASMLQEVGVHVPLRPLHHVMDVRLPDRQVPILVPRDEWLAALRTSFPERTFEVLRFWRAVEETARAAYAFAKTRTPLPIQTREDFLRALAVAAAHRGLLSVGLKRSRATVLDVLREFCLDDYGPFRRFIDAQLLDAVQTTSDEAAWLPSCLALEIYRYGVWIPEGGVPALAAAMADRAREAGVHLLFSNTVTDATRRPGSTPWHVKTNRGHELCVDAVINATGTRVTPHADEPVSGDPASTNDRAPQWGAIRIDAWMREPGVEQGWSRPDSRAPFAVQLADDTAMDASRGEPCGPLYVTFHPAQPALGVQAAEGGAEATLVTISAHTDACAWLALSKSAYRERKQQVLHKVLERLDAYLPRFAEHLMSYSMGTPVTYARYLNKAWVGGIPLTVAHAIRRPRGPRTAWPHWYLAGDTVFPGPGMLSAALSGFFAARAIDPRVGQSTYNMHRSVEASAKR
ncbi:phytoene desaturase family protein [Alicyclobacillus sendaiensis]|uniref:FAD-dependent oxidoreductase n=1 Tax=Alicyclobacillus sendaiensis PA2 TaxID=3029425 RepID=A0ABT6XWX5_ALISE|nr:FAD-dependent oxidoreductase [Alicyclobacillus sendaiensis]MDI9259598.1 FAD-dependent oxidoreductase [Alicyclobacillus sendaiensis PA2]